MPEVSHRPLLAPVVGRRLWESADPRQPYGVRGPLRAVVLHHTNGATGSLETGDPNAEAGYMRRIQRGHFERGFDDIGYHFVIMPSGRIFLGRPTWAVGAHVKGHNADTVGIALAGDFNSQGPTSEAIRAIGQVRSTLIPSGVTVPLLGHSDLAAKDCPGASLIHYLNANVNR
jgi:N-acetylmuramoyl-L-alanine amidase